MDKSLSLLTGVGIGAGLMYMLDPEFGRRRRKTAGHKAASLAHTSEESVGKAVRDLGSRARGLAAEARRTLKHEQVPDDVLLARVTSRLGRHVSHPAALGITTQDGRVTLTGQILAREVDDALCAVWETRGVTDVDDRLEVHETEAVPALQGGVTRTEERFQ